MDEKYIEIVKVINELIGDFNKFLNTDFKINQFDLNEVNNKQYFTYLLKKQWDDFRFPNSEKRGVYFIIGYNSVLPENRAVYIGKSSFKHKIGKRFYSHLSRYRDAEQYVMTDKNGAEFFVEYIFSIDLETPGTEFLASSLEEFMILKAKDKIHLLNRVGTG
jgi:hypothetical protein